MGLYLGRGDLGCSQTGIRAHVLKPFRTGATVLVFYKLHDSHLQPMLCPQYLQGLRIALGAETCAQGQAATWDTTVHVLQARILLHLPQQAWTQQHKNCKLRACAQTKLCTHTCASAICAQNFSWHWLLTCMQFLSISSFQFLIKGPP